MTPSNDSIRAERARASLGLLHRLREAGWRAEPILDDQLLDKWGRVYDERKGDRWFVVDFAPDTNFDAFLKKTGLNDEVDVLYVLSPGGEIYDEILWSIYSRWMHSTADIIEMEDYLRGINLG